MGVKHKILVTGGAGYIGNWVVERLLDAGHEVRILDALLFGDQALRPFSGHPNLTLIQGDTRHIEDLVVGLKKTDIVIHLAAIVGDLACDLNPEATRTVNVEATKVLMELCHCYEVKRLIFASSCSVYGASWQALLNEGSALNPLSLYAETRIESENIILNGTGGAFARSDDGLSPTVLRFGTLYGFSRRMRFDLAINILTARALAESYIPIYGGDQCRPFLHVQDAADAIVAVAQAPEEQICRQIFNVGSTNQNLEIREVGRLIKDRFPEAELVFIPHTEDHRNYRVSFEKINQVVGWKAIRTIEEGIDEVTRVFQREEIDNYRDERYYNSNYEYL